MRIAPSHRSILIVEDEPLIRMIAAETLQDHGLQIYEAANADEALTAMDEHPDIGLMFSDINMPGKMDGLALAEQVHARRPDVELIITSAAQNVIETELPDHGSFLAKPYTQHELVLLIERKFSDARER